MPLFAKLLLAVALAASLPLAAQSTRARKTEEKKPRPCREPADHQLTLGDVALLLTSSETACATEDVKKRGVTFQADPISIEVLKALGASDELINLIPPPPPPPPPVKLSGALTILCQPSECEVLVNDRDYGVSEGGKKVITEIPAGTARIQVRSDGFEPVVRTAALSEGEAHQEIVTLSPTLAARREQGRTLLLKVIAEFGGMEGLAAMSEAFGNGKAALPDMDGQLKEWDLRFAGRWGSVTLTLQSAQGDCSASISSDTPKGECKGKLKQSKHEAVMARAAALFRYSELPMILAKMATLEVVENDSKGRKIETEGKGDSYILSLDSSGVPEEVVWRPSTGEPLRFSYSKYLMKDNLRYPGQVEIFESEKPAAVFSMNDLPSQLSGSSNKKGR